MIIDITGIELTPGNQGKDCLGNGEHQEFECCCDECDYLMRCMDVNCFQEGKNRQGQATREKAASKR